MKRPTMKWTTQVWFPAETVIILSAMSRTRVGTGQYPTEWIPWAPYSGVRKLKRESDLSPPSGVKVNNPIIFPSTLPVSFQYMLLWHTDNSTFISHSLSSIVKYKEQYDHSTFWIPLRLTQYSFFSCGLPGWCTCCSQDCLRTQWDPVCWSQSCPPHWSPGQSAGPVAEQMVLTPRPHNCKAQTDTWASA